MGIESFSVSPDCEIVNTRIIDLPREKVFGAWTNPGRLKRWWGPKGFTNTFKEFDLKPGGHWSFIMHGPEGGNYSNECVFLKIEKPSLIAWDRLSNPIFRMVITFEEVAGKKTKLTFRMQFADKESSDKIRTFAPGKNEENLDRLEAELFAAEN